VVGGVLAATAGNSASGHFFAYGEMVDLLWRAGKAEAAIALEELWNEIGNDYSFSLLCAYVMDNFNTERDARGFAEVCRTHSRVVPTERYLALQDSDARLREISALQQRARALESEVAHRKQVEKELREAVKVRDDFLCVAGHELRTPLTVLRLQLASLLANESANQTPRIERRLAALAGQTERLSRLAERLVDASQMGEEGVALQPETMDLAAMAKDAVDTLADIADAAGCRVTLLGDSSVIGCWDRDRLEQVLQDLLSNAFKFGRGSEVHVLVKGLRDHAELIVRDGGGGVPAGEQDRIFERFARAQRTESFGGLGLGLWIARRIVDAHGGDIRVESSSEKKGAVFTVRLPYALTQAG
jgi:signal transduction histidine kinase